jgi:hypothetical protein
MGCRAIVDYDGDSWDAPSWSRWMFQVFCFEDTSPPLILMTVIVFDDNLGGNRNI